MYCTILSIAPSRRKLQASVAPPSSSTPWTSRLPSAAISAIGETPPDRSASSTIASAPTASQARTRTSGARSVVATSVGAPSSNTAAAGSVRPLESTTTRVGCHASASSGARTVSCGSSASTVPAPTTIASDHARNRWASARASGDEIQREEPSMRGRLAVERGGHLPDDEGQPGADVTIEGAVSPMGLLGEHTFDDLNACGSQTGDASAVHERVRVGGGHDDARDTGGDQGVGARRCRRVMVAGLQGGVHRRAAGSVPRLGERPDLCVRCAARAGVPAAPDRDAARVHDHRADHRVGRDVAETTFGERERLPHVLDVRVRCVHVPPCSGARTRHARPPHHAAAPTCPVPSHPDSDGRFRNRTGSTHRWRRRGRGLLPPVGTFTPPRKQAAPSISRHDPSREPGNQTSVRRSTA